MSIFYYFREDIHGTTSTKRVAVAQGGAEYDGGSPPSPTLPITFPHTPLSPTQNSAVMVTSGSKEEVSTTVSSGGGVEDTDGVAGGSMGAREEANAAGAAVSVSRGLRISARVQMKQKREEERVVDASVVPSTVNKKTEVSGEFMCVCLKKLFVFS